MTTVFTNGCFDIMHAGHVRLLRYAKSLGDQLIVGINSDESCKRLKGPTRPIFSQKDRAFILNALDCVDNVLPFHSDTPEILIHEIRPNVLVKGPEAANALIPGAEFVKSYGGQVITPDWDIPESTTKIIEQVLLSERPLPQELAIILEEKKQEELENFTLRFNKQPDGWRPILYQNGKRVVKPYFLKLDHYQPADKHGRSA